MCACACVCTCVCVCVLACVLVVSIVHVLVYFVVVVIPCSALWCVSVCGCMLVCLCVLCCVLVICRSSTSCCSECYKSTHVMLHALECDRMFAAVHSVYAYEPPYLE